MKQTFIFLMKQNMFEDFFTVTWKWLCYTFDKRTCKSEFELEVEINANTAGTLS